MKILIVMGIALVLASTSVAESRSDWWPEGDVIGLFEDEDAVRIDENIFPYTPVEVHLLAVLYLSFDEGISFARFRLDNLPSNEGYPVGQYSMEFSSDLTLGEIDHDFSITWTEPQGAGHGIVSLGTIEFLMFDSDWIAEDHMISARRGLDCDCLYTIDGSGQAHGATGCSFFFNCTNPEECSIGYSPCWDGEPVPTEVSSWSLVKSLF